MSSSIYKVELCNNVIGSHKIMELDMHPSNGIQNRSSPDIWSLGSGVSTSSFRKPVSQYKQKLAHCIDLLSLQETLLCFILIYCDIDSSLDWKWPPSFATFFDVSEQKECVEGIWEKMWNNCFNPRDIIKEHCNRSEQPLQFCCSEHLHLRNIQIFFLHQDHQHLTLSLFLWFISNKTRILKESPSPWVSVG